MLKNLTYRTWFKNILKLETISLEVKVIINDAAFVNIKLGLIYEYFYIPKEQINCPKGLKINIKALGFREDLIIIML